jgi:SPOR domain
MTTSDEIDLRDEDRLPWLETVEPDEPEGPGVFRVVALVVLGLALVSAIVFGIYQVQQRSGSSEGTGELIAAQEGDYKVRPDDPGGLQVKGEGDSAIATSAGSNAASSIDLKAVPETPITGVAPAERVPGAGGRLKATAPMAAPRTTVPGAGSGGALVQLGAFPSEAAANAAWSAVAKRFGYVATLGKEVQPADVNGRKVFRLRVNAGSATAASDICGRLKVAGESCFVTS